jgi:hypothetical protein
LFAALRDAESKGIDVGATLPQLVQATTLAGADDIAAVIHGRVQNYVRANGTKRQAATNLVAGLVPRAIGVTDPDMLRALTDRDRGMEERARDLAEQAITQGRSWITELGPMPADPAAAGTWFSSAATVAAYRERWGVNGREAIGGEPRTIEEIGHQKRAIAAVEQAQRLSQPVPPVPPDQTSVGPEPTTEGVTL